MSTASVTRRLRGLFNQLIDVPPTDADDARRRKLLNVLLLGVETLALFILIALLIATATAGEGELGSDEEVFGLLAGSVVLLIGLAGIFVINRFWSGTVAAWLFVLLFIAVAAFSDTAENVVDGRSMFIFVIPILMASVILRPATSFVAAALSGAIIAGLGTNIGFAVNFAVILGFFAVALVSWLAMRSLERALEDLRTINRELDQRVAERTQDLANALTRVQTESGKTQAILESIADGVIVFDSAGRATVANPAIHGLMNLDPQHVIGQDIAKLLQDAGHPQAHEQLESFLHDPTTYAGGLKIGWGKKTLSVSSAPVQLDSSEASGVVAVFRDFTREAELDRMKSAFVSMASHEVRTPLNAILGYADMLREHVYGPLLDDQAQIINRVIANTKRMLGLVNNLLDQSQIDAGRLTLSNKPFSPADLLDEVESVMEVLAVSKGLAFICELDETVPAQLVGDAPRLSQILINLIGNAIKFTSAGEVRVRLARPDDDHWSLIVSDTGSGIPPEAQRYIFEPFRQVDDPITRKTEGSGLGLSIVKQLTTLMGGEISLRSEVGAGSTFTLVLPIEPVSQAKEPST